MLRLTKKQQEAFNIINNYDRNKSLYFLLYGGSQSAKTSFACYYIQLASIMYPNTTSIICRKQFTDLKATIVQNTFPSMLKLRYGDDAANNPKFIRYNLSPPLSAEFFNGSKIYFIGLEDNSGFEKILGRKASMFLIDEASEVGYKAFSKLTTRLSENNNARKVGFVTMNPTSIFHWPYRLFIERVNPVDREPLKNSDFFKNLQMNPKDNLDNLPEGYLNNLENLSKEERERFLFGNFLTSAEGAVYEDQLKVAQEENRICELHSPKFNIHYPIHIAMDIGWDDFNSCWCYQVLPQGVKFIFYIEERHVDIVSFLVKIKEKILDLNKKWIETICWLPHDATHHWVGNGMTLKNVLTLHSSYTVDKPISYKILEKKGIYEGLNACRIIFNKCTFDKEMCRLGIDRLGQYKEYDSSGDGFYRRQTKHDDSSHCADAFRYAISSFYFQKPFQEDFRRDANAIYGFDILNKRTKQNLGIY